MILFTVKRDNDPTHTTKAKEDVLRERGGIFCSGLISLQTSAPRHKRMVVESAPNS